MVFKLKMRTHDNKKTIKWLSSRKRVCIRLHKSTNQKRARALGYVPGMVLVAGRINKGGRKAPMPNHGRSTIKMLKRKNIRMSLQNRLEKRISRLYQNLEVLNSYKIGQNGQFMWYEIILAKGLSRGRAMRGLTSSARKNIRN